MNNEQKRLFNLMGKIPDLRDLAVPIEDLPGEAEFAKSLADVGADLDQPFHVDLDSPMKYPMPATDAPDAPLTAKQMDKTTRICIRVPTLVLRAIKQESKRRGARYQSAINMLLKAAAADKAPAT